MLTLQEMPSSRKRNALEILHPSEQELKNYPGTWLYRSSWRRKQWLLCAMERKKWGRAYEWEECRKWWRPASPLLSMYVLIRPHQIHWHQKGSSIEQQKERVAWSRCSTSSLLDTWRHCYRNFQSGLCNWIVFILPLELMNISGLNWKIGCLIFFCSSKKYLCFHIRQYTRFE